MILRRSNVSLRGQIDSPSLYQTFPSTCNFDTSQRRDRHIARMSNDLINFQITRDFCNVDIPLAGACAQTRRAAIRYVRLHEIDLITYARAGNQLHPIAPDIGVGMQLLNGSGRFNVRYSGLVGDRSMQKDIAAGIGDHRNISGLTTDEVHADFVIRLDRVRINILYSLLLHVMAVIGLLPIPGTLGPVILQVDVAA